MKNNRRKVLSHRRIRTSKNFSNCSLSQILQIASYKKRINDLSRNNHHITTALQESIIKSAFQDDLLKSYAKDANQILFARIKLNEMAKNLAKFATDLEEVRSCLDIDGPTDYDFFRKKSSSSERISKVPDMSCIDELSECSENGITSSENSDTLQSSSKESLDFINGDIEMTPVILADDIGLQEERTNDAVRKSVTSKTAINLECVTQRRSTRSSGKISLHKNDSSTFKELDMHIDDLTPSVMKKQDPIKTIKIETLTSSFPASKIEDDSENTSIIVQKNCDESANISSHDCSSVKSGMNKSIKTSDIASSSKIIGLNHSTLLCENNDLDEKNISLQPLNNESNLLFEANVEDDLEIHSIEEKEKNYVNDELSPKNDSQKLSEGLLNTSSLCHGVQLPEISEYDDEIQNVGSLTFCESNDDDDDDDEIQNVGELTFCEPNEDEEEIQNVGEPTSCKPNDDGKNKNVDGCEPSRNGDEFKNAVSPYVRSSRSKKPVKYADYFLPDEFSPTRLSAGKRKAHKNVKLFSSEKIKSDEISAEKNDIDSEVENPENDYSVFNLDVSNSKITGKKTKKKLKHKKTNEDLPKPLFHKCSVTKLKAGKFKFSKLNETSSELKNVNKHSEKPLQNYCASPGGILKKVQCRTPQIFENNKNEAVDIIDVENDIEQIVLQTPKSASKKVSFAPTDLVCSFVKMSESKTIADNRKVRRTSKSCLDFEKLFKEEESEEEDREESKTPPVNADKFSESTDVQKTNSLDISVTTKLCTVVIPSHENILNDVPLEFCVSEQIQLLSKDNDKRIKHSSSTPNSPKSSKRLSLKGNKVTHTATSNVSSLTLKEADILFLESPVAVLKRPKRVSLFKESTDDNSEEHTNSNHLAFDKKNSLKEKTHMNENSSPILNIAIKTSSYSKCEDEIPSKVSIRKNKKSNPEIALERSVLIDSTNLTEGNISRRRSKQVCYKEPSLMKKLRRE